MKASYVFLLNWKDITYYYCFNRLASPGPNIKFNDIIISVRQEADKLHKAGVKIIIALGHAGIFVDRKVARSVDHVDIVVGGHSNTFLYNGKINQWHFIVLL